VTLAQEQPAARAQQVRHDPGPAADVRQPAERADAGVHQVEAAASQLVGGPVDVRFDVFDRGAGLFGDAPGLRERRRGEVQPRHRRAEPGQRHRVRTDVALQMHAAQAAEIAQPGQVEADHVAEVRRVVGER
jgi:hypothetical protein